jgi:hypothetical protein
VACDEGAAQWYASILYLNRDILSMIGHIQHSGLSGKSFLGLEASFRTSCLISATASDVLEVDGVLPELFG